MAALNAELIAACCRRYGARIAWCDADGARSFMQLLQDIQALRAAWQTLALPRGARVAVYGLSSYATWIAVLAGMSEGLVMAPLPSRLHPEHLEIYRSQLPFAALHGSNALNWPGLLILPQLTAARVAASDLTAHESVPLLKPEHVPPAADEAALLIFSSGSSGAPKAIQHSLAGLVASAGATLAFYQPKLGASWLLSLDLGHIGGFQIALRCLLGGLRCLAGYAPQDVEQALSAEAADYVSLVPTQLQRLLQNGETQRLLQPCRAILLGGAGISAPLLAAARAAALPLSITYGASEAASQITVLAPGEYPMNAATVGRLLPIWKASRVDGCLALEGPALCQGWWQDLVFKPLPAGPLVLADSVAWHDDQLQVLGRRDTIFQVGGENVAPAEIQNALQPLAAGGEWIVLPQADPEYGQVPILIYRDAAPPPSRRLIEACLQPQLPRIKHPRACYWHHTRELEKPARGWYAARLLDGTILEQQWRI